MSDLLFSAVDLSEQVENLAQTIKGIEMCRNMASSRLSELEQEESNILHEIERPRCLYKNRAQLATKLQRVLMERREIKDWLAVNKAIFAFADSDKYINLSRLLEAFLGESRKAAKREKQIYYGVNVDAMKTDAQ